MVEIGSQCTSYISFRCFSAWYMDFSEQQIYASIRLLPGEAEDVCSWGHIFPKKVSRAESSVVSSFSQLSSAGGSWCQAGMFWMFPSQGTAQPSVGAHLRCVRQLGNSLRGSLASSAKVMTGHTPESPRLMAPTPHHFLRSRVLGGLRLRKGK